MSRKLKLGLIGLGNIGTHHLSYLREMDNVELVGVCDVVTSKADKVAEDVGTRAYYRVEDLLEQSGAEAVLVAVPHFDHVPITITSLNRGIHVLCEKPLAVHVNDAQKAIDAYETARQKFPDLRFGMMFNERTVAVHRKLKEIVDSGQLGQLVRATWIHTKWFRSQAYYNSGGWRASWGGEGGGILTNQCPHNLDMYQWLFGLPNRITGHAHLGKYHDIEVEDEVTAYFEHENGMIGHFIVNTTELPGTNRLEIVGEHGKLIFEEGKVVLHKNSMSMLKYSRETDAVWGGIESQVEEIEVTSVPSGHGVLTAQFVEAVLDGKQAPLVAEGREGINSIMLANGIMLSSFTGRTVDVPIDGDAFEQELQKKMQTSRYVRSKA